MAKFYPKMFGDKTTTTLEGGDKPIQTQAVQPLLNIDPLSNDDKTDD
jgi:hypothetical protein